MNMQACVMIISMHTCRLLVWLDILINKSKYNKYSVSYRNSFICVSSAAIVQLYAHDARTYF